MLYRIKVISSSTGLARVDISHTLTIEWIFTGFVKGELGRRLQLRRAPSIVFQLDRGLVKGTQLLNLLGKLDS